MKLPFSQPDWNSSHCITSDLPTPERAEQHSRTEQHQLQTLFSNCSIQPALLRTFHAFVKYFCKFWPMSLEFEVLISRKLHNSFYKCCPRGGLVKKKSLCCFQEPRRHKCTQENILSSCSEGWFGKKKIKWSCLECSLQIWHLCSWTCFFQLFIVLMNKGGPRPSIKEQETLSLQRLPHGVNS